MAKFPRQPTPPHGGVPNDFAGPEESTGIRELRTLDARMQRLELRDASFFGSEGVEGAWSRHTKEHAAMKVDVEALKGFRIKIALLITLCGVALGGVAEIASHVIEKAWHG